MDNTEYLLKLKKEINDMIRDTNSLSFIQIYLIKVIFDIEKQLNDKEQI